MAKKKGQDKPVTRAEVQKIVDDGVDELAQVTAKNFARVDKRMDGLATQKSVDKIQKTMNLLLKIVTKSDEDVKELKSHDLPDRVTANENDILKLKARVG